MENKQPMQNRKNNYIFLLLLLGLIFLRFPFLLLSAYHKLPIDNELGNNLFRDGTYLLTAMLIILKRDSLSDYHFGFCSVSLFLAAPVLKLLSGYLLMRYASVGTVPPDPWFQVAVSLCLFLVLLFFRPKLRTESFKKILLWLSIAVAAGICGGVFFGNLISLQGGGRIPDHPSVLLLICSFFIQLSNAAVLEEPLFRGFLWGFLKNMHWKDYWIWLFQAALFMLGHIYYLGAANYSFWIVIPLGALILGLLAWRSRSIGTSMIAHGLFNSLADLVAHMTW